MALKYPDEIDILTDPEAYGLLRQVYEDLPHLVKTTEDKLIFQQIGDTIYQMPFDK